MLWNVYRTIFNHRKSYFMKLAIKDFKKDEDAEVYVMIIINLIENRQQPDNRIKLEGVLKYHSKSCPKDTCYCRQLLVDNTKDEDAQILSKKWFLFVKSILEESLEKFVKSSRLHLLHAHIQHEKLKNKFKALFEIMIAKENKPNIQEEFSMFRFAIHIEDEIKDNDEKQGDTRNVDVNKIVLFQKNFIEFQSSIDKSVQLHLDFWRELLEDNPEISKIENMGSKITQTVGIVQVLLMIFFQFKKVKDQFEKLREIHNNHIMCLEIYGYFLKDIVNDDIEGDRILESMKYAKNSQSVNKQFIDQDRLKYGENSNTAILTVSGNYGSIGTVTNLNNELQRFLNKSLIQKCWSKTDILDQNIQRIMPKVYADVHDKFMERYLDTSEKTIIGLERLVLCQKKNQFLIPCTLMIKVLPNLQEGIQFVGFLKDIDNSTNQIQASSRKDEDLVHYMIYRVDNDSYVMQGITQSCYTSLGIPSSLMYGNSSNNVELTVDTICPDLLNPENYEELKSPGGLIVTIDTTTVQQNFLLDEDDSEDEDYEDLNSNLGKVELYKDELGESERKSKFKRTRVRMNLIEEQTYFDRKINVVKFIEIDETTDLEIKPSNQEEQQQHNQMGGSLVQTREGQYNKNHVQISQQQQNFQAEEDINASEMDSNVSNSQINEDIRVLKDFKSLISEKKVPKSISILKKTVIAISVIVLVLSGIELSFKLSQGKEISTGVNSIFNSFQRPEIMADVNFYTRRVYNVANEIRLPQGQSQDQAFAQNQDKVKILQKNNTINYLLYYKKLAQNVNLLQTIQFKIMKNLINLGSSTYDDLSTKLYSIKFQQQQKNDVKSYQNILTDAMIQMITSSSSLANSTKASFIQDTNSQFVAQTLKNMYYVVDNGLFVLRSAVEYESNEIYDYYYDETDGFENSFKIILILGIIFLILSILIIIPYVFKVNTTNNRVLSLFGMIPLVEIKELALRCEEYSNKFIEDKKNQQDEFHKNIEGDDEIQIDASKVNNKEDIEIDGENLENESSKIEIDQSKIDKDEVRETQGDTQQQYLGVTNTSNIRSNNNTSNIRSNINNQSMLPISGIRRPSQEMSQIKTSGQPQKQDQKKDDGTQKLQKKQHEEDDAENLRSQKLMNTRDNNRKKIIFQFLFFTLIFITYFVVSFVLELQFLKNMRQILNHLNQVSQRNAIIKYMLVYMVEEVTNDVIQMQEGEDNLQKFINKSYVIENSINTSSLENYPGEFDSYFNTFQTANYNDFCSTFPQSNDLTVTKCSEINSKMLQKGLKVSITSYVEGIRDLITEYTNAKDKTKEKKQKVFADVSYTVLEDMQFYMCPMIQSLNSQLVDAIQLYVDNQNHVYEIKFGVFFAFVFLVFILIWLPYLKKLNQKIWRTKGMLNMIPMDIITKDPNLKQAFVSGDILQAVK